MRRQRTFADIWKLIDDLKACQRLHDKIIGQVKQLPKDWHESAEQAGYSQVFCSLCEDYFKPLMMDRVNLVDFMIACKKLKNH